MIEESVCLSSDTALGLNLHKLHCTDYIAQIILQKLLSWNFISLFPSSFLSFFHSLFISFFQSLHKPGLFCFICTQRRGRLSRVVSLLPLALIQTSFFHHCHHHRHHHHHGHHHHHRHQHDRHHYHYHHHHQGESRNTACNIWEILF